MRYSFLSTHELPFSVLVSPIIRNALHSPHGLPHKSTASNFQWDTPPSPTESLLPDLGNICPPTALAKQLAGMKETKQRYQVSDR